MKTGDAGVNPGAVNPWGMKNVVFMIAFLLMASFSLIFWITFIVHASRAGKPFVTMPVFKSRYTSVYGDPVGNDHVSLFGATDLVVSGTGSFMPMAPIPVSFDDGLSTIDTNLTYYRCMDASYQSMLPLADRSRLIALCEKERSKQVAMYRNDPTSISFGSAWNPLFMSMVCLWLYASWGLLLWSWGGRARSFKWIVYVTWQVVIFGTVLISAILQVDRTVIPRNNIIYSLVLVFFTVGQQLITIYRACRRGRQVPGAADSLQNLFESIDLVDCIDDQKSIVSGEDNGEYQNYRVVNVVLNSQILLFPTMVLSLYTIGLHTSLEWVIQPIWVRMVLFIACLILVHYRKINPLVVEHVKWASMVSPAPSAPSYVPPTPREPDNYYKMDRRFQPPW
eukprot:52657-Hanusia_phi.AAC.7